MMDQVNLEDLLFLDIETVPQKPAYEELNSEEKAFWDEKALKSEMKRYPDKEIADLYPRAGIYAEFGKIICISVGLFSSVREKKFRVKSFYGDDEKSLLQKFGEMLLKIEKKKRSVFLCAHNGKEFDFPYISRRMIINRVPLPASLNIAGKKPWEVNFIDTMELWKFGDYKHFTSLNLLTHILEVPTPKDDIDGSMVARVYWEDKDLSRIVRYCEKDVVAVVQLLLRFRGEELISEENIETVTDFN